MLSNVSVGGFSLLDIKWSRLSLRCVWLIIALAEDWTPRLLSRWHIKAWFPLPELTARVNGPSWRVTGFHYPSTRAVLTGTLFPLAGLTNTLDKTPLKEILSPFWGFCPRFLPHEAFVWGAFVGGMWRRCICPSLVCPQSIQLSDVMLLRLLLHELSVSQTCHSPATVSFITGRSLASMLVEDCLMGSVARDLKRLLTTISNKIFRTEYRFTDNRITITKQRHTSSKYVVYVLYQRSFQFHWSYVSITLSCT